MMTAHDFAFRALAGGELPLSQFAGKPILLVNTASECGYTPQYAGLQALWVRYRDRGLVVLGVPSNDFGEQEPGDEAAIAAFCTTVYQVDFPLTAKEHVIGADAHPLYRWIVESIGEAAAVEWNFHKYLFDADGELAELWPSKVEPDDPTLIGTIETALEG
jgi:glutathione peroxidase